MVKRKGERRDGSTKERRDQSKDFVGRVRHEEGGGGDCAVIEMENAGEGGQIMVGAVSGGAENEGRLQLAAGSAI